MDTSYYVDTSYGYNAASVSGLVGGMLIFVLITWLIAIAASVLMIISMWKIFKKLGKPGWASIIPIYNVYVLCCEIAQKPWWYLLLLCVPFANIFVMFIVYDVIAKKFGKDTVYTIGILFLPIIFLPMLAFSKNNDVVLENDIEKESQNMQQTFENSNFTSDFNNSQNNVVQNEDLEKTNINLGTVNEFSNNFSNETNNAPVMPIAGNDVINNEVNQAYSTKETYDNNSYIESAQNSTETFSQSNGLYEVPKFDNNVVENVNNQIDNTRETNPNLNENSNTLANDFNTNVGLDNDLNKQPEVNSINNFGNQNVYSSNIGASALTDNEKVNAPSSEENQNDNNLNNRHTSLWSNNNQNNTQI